MGEERDERQVIIKEVINLRVGWPCEELERDRNDVIIVVMFKILKQKGLLCEPGITI